MSPCPFPISGVNSPCDHTCFLFLFSTDSWAQTEFLLLTRKAHLSSQALSTTGILSALFSFGLVCQTIPCSLETGPQVLYLPTYLCTYQSVFLFFLRQYLKVECSNSPTLANQKMPGISLSASSPYLELQA